MTDKTMVIAPEGDVTMVTLGRLIAAHRITGRAGPITLDLAKMTSCDSAVMALITTLRAECEKRGAQFEIKSAPESIHALAEIYGLGDLIRQSIRV